ncbi:MAG: helix-hairpin-helix domain-containing protein [Sandaracinaceae bacterium]|nr:helix-hairpin-helix domain-containing protein [Sandaracinaceae bacterium]
MLRHTAATWLGVMVAVTLLLALAPRTARAVQYEMLIDVDNEEDLQELFTTGQISEDTWNTLVQIMRRGVDLNRADREALYALPNLTYEDVDAILAYRQEAGVLNDPAALVPAGVLTAEQLLQIAPFLTVGEEFRPLSATNGRVRFQMVGSPADDRAPSMALQARVSTLRHLSLGLAMVTTRLRLGDLRYDPTRDALSAEGQRTRLHVPKFFVRWEGDHAEVLLGTFRAGFGQRLTFDNSDRFTPNGVYADDAVFWNPSMSTSCRDSTGELSASPCSGPEGQERVTSDLRWRNSLMGVAVGAEHLSLGDGWLQLYAFGLSTAEHLPIRNLRPRPLRRPAQRRRRRLRCARHLSAPRRLARAHQRVLVHDAGQRVRRGARRRQRELLLQPPRPRGRHGLRRSLALPDRGHGPRLPGVVAAPVRRWCLWRRGRGCGRGARALGPLPRGGALVRRPARRRRWHRRHRAQHHHLGPPGARADHALLRRRLRQPLRAPHRRARRAGRQPCPRRGGRPRPLHGHRGQRAEPARLGRPVEPALGPPAAAAGLRARGPRGG